MNASRSYLDERLAQRRWRALGALAVAGAMAAGALWLLADAESFDSQPVAAVSTPSG